MSLENFRAFPGGEIGYVRNIFESSQTENHEIHVSCTVTSHLPSGGNGPPIPFHGDHGSDDGPVKLIPTSVTEDGHGKSENWYRCLEDWSLVVLMVLAHTPPMSDSDSKTMGLKPLERQYLHARRPEIPAPTIATCLISIVSGNAILDISDELMKSRSDEIADSHPSSESDLIDFPLSRPAPPRRLFAPVVCSLPSVLRLQPYTNSTVSTTASSEFEFMASNTMTRIEIRVVFVFAKFVSCKFVSDTDTRHDDTNCQKFHPLWLVGSLYGVACEVVRSKMIGEACFDSEEHSTLPRSTTSIFVQHKSKWLEHLFQKLDRWFGEAKEKKEGYKGGKLVEGGSTGASSDPKASIS
ncbi:hypothetical protein LXL04_025294 [Taraxacum kok-saghyz]